MKNLEVQESSIVSFEHLLNSGPIGITVLVTLFLFSLISWFVIIGKSMQLRRFFKNSEAFMEIFWQSKNLSELSNRANEYPYSPAREVFRGGYNETVKVLQVKERSQSSLTKVSFETVKRTLNKTISFEESKLFSGLNFLSISASTAPFIGLFGTVVGIIKSFQGISVSGSSSLSSVAPGISEALIATALGLIVAIPATIFFNLFSNKISYHLMMLEGFSVDFLNIIERHFNIGKSGEIKNADE